MVYTSEEIECLTTNCTDKNKIGSGAFGNVHEVDFKGNKIAIKASTDKSDTKRSQWTNEIEALGKLQHRHIIQLLGHWEDSKKFYLAYDFMPICLFNQIEGLNWADMVKVLKQTATALSHIHGNEYVFGDLKPQNILLDKENNVKICDFGTVIKEGTKKWVHVKTPGYIAPEAERAASGTRESDIYSLGILILQLISKRGDMEEIEEQKGKQRKGKAPAQHDQKIRPWADLECQKNGHVVNKKLYQTCDHEKVASITKLGLQCSHDHVRARPPIATVIEKLDALL